MQLTSRRIYTGRVINLDVDQVRFPDGSSGELEIIRHPGAAAVVPVASDLGSADPSLLMIRQYRYATAGELWEIPAGRLAHPAEDPEACARRDSLAADVRFQARPELGRHFVGREKARHQALRPRLPSRELPRRMLRSTSVSS